MYVKLLVETYMNVDKSLPSKQELTLFKQVTSTKLKESRIYLQRVSKLKYISRNIIPPEGTQPRKAWRSFAYSQGEPAGSFAGFQRL